MPPARAVCGHRDSSRVCSSGGSSRSRRRRRDHAGSVLGVDSSAEIPGSERGGARCSKRPFRRRQPESLVIVEALLGLLLLVTVSFVEYSDAFLPKHKKVLLIKSALLARRAPGGRSGSSPRGFGPNQNRGFANKNSTFVDYSAAASAAQPSRLELELQQRVTQLEQLVASQTVELKRLKDEVKDLTSAAEAFAKVVELLRQAGLDPEGKELGKNKLLSKEDGSKEASLDSSAPKTIVKEALDDTTGQIFGSAPSSVIEAADAAGASILAAILGGKKRLLVDVRDAELSSSSETLVQFIELAVLPVAAGLEGLKSKRNRLKIVFPTVSQLLEYRKTMALAAPEVVALSTLGFDPVEQQDNLVVIVAPPPDDAEGLAAMNELLEPKEAGNRKPIDQPLVVLNHHMVPISGPAAAFEVAYHLRLLSVQYMTGNAIPEDLQQRLNETMGVEPEEQPPSDARDAAVEAAMRHAHAGGQHYGVTRAMVIRAYPKPWHVFVDTSPDTDADFVVAATFDDEPPLEEVNRSIVECLEGSEEEDEIVAQQMQQALESGQLDRVTEMLGSMGVDIFDEDDDEVDDDDDFDDDVWNIFKEDSV